jgi:hypothetical protein
MVAIKALSLTHGEQPQQYRRSDAMRAPLPPWLSLVHKSVDPGNQTVKHILAEEGPVAGLTLQLDVKAEVGEKRSIGHCAHSMMAWCARLSMDGTSAVAQQTGVRLGRNPLADVTAGSVPASIHWRSVCWFSFKTARPRPRP